LQDVGREIGRFTGVGRQAHPAWQVGDRAEVLDDPLIGRNRSDG
jgi:hypothetical protein